VNQRSNRSKKRLLPGDGGESGGGHRCLLGVADGTGSGIDGKPTWGLTLLDLKFEGEWSWNIDASRVDKVMTSLREMERSTWREIMDMKTGGNRRCGALHKFIPVAHLCDTAQRRLYDLEIDFDQLFRFRFGNMHRLWGALPMPSGVFYPIWYDAHHKVCPSKDPD
jgi:hypothetical protein